MSPIISTLANGSAYGYRTLAAAGGVAAYESIASATGTGSSGTITFSSIPSTYTSLQIRLLGNTSGFQAPWGLRINGSSTASDYYAHKLTGDGTSVTAGSYIPSTNNYMWVGETSGSASNSNVAIIDLHDYALTTNKKTVRSFTGYNNNNTITLLVLSSGLYMQTTAISSLSIFCGSDWTNTTQVALYGIKGA
jgi:hypothetical protein